MNQLKRTLASLYLICLVLLPVVAVWIWVDDGMWINGALPTHGLIYVVAGCGIALIMRGIRSFTDNPP